MGVAAFLTRFFQAKSNPAPTRQRQRQQATYLDQPFSDASGNILHEIPEDSSHPLDQRMHAAFSSSTSKKPAFREFGVALSDINDILSETGTSEQIRTGTEKDGVRKEVRHFLDGRKLVFEGAADPENNDGQASFVLRFSTGNGQNGREISFYGRSYLNTEQEVNFLIDAVSYKGKSGNDTFIVTQAGTEENIAEALSIMEDTFTRQPCQILPFAPPARAL